jgi:hypothetical protein
MDECARIKLTEQGLVWADIHLVGAATKSGLFRPIGVVTNATQQSSLFSCNLYQPI